MAVAALSGGCATAQGGRPTPVVEEVDLSAFFPDMDSTFVVL